jgi:branched-chain amino acid transport system permease protein
MLRHTFNRIGFPILFIGLCMFPLISSNYTISILSEILILAIFAISLNILVGYTGLVSLGHAAFFGVGAYSSSLIAIHVTTNVWISLAVSLFTSLIVAGIIGYFCNKVHGFYFLMLTLAFSQMIYAVVHEWKEVTGGDNGLSSIPKPSLFEGVAISEPLHLYFFIFIVFTVVFYVVKRFVQSPLGAVLVGIRENETRMRSMGYNTTFYKNLVFIVAGGLGGVSGSLYSYFNGFVSPEDVFWTTSSEVLIMVLIGGAGTLLGPVLGAAFIVVLETFISSYTDQWMMIIGVTFILFVIFVPKGIVGISSVWMKKHSVQRDSSAKTESSKPSVAN